MCLYNKKGMNTWNDIYDFSEKVLSYILRKKEEEYIQPDQDSPVEKMADKLGNSETSPARSPRLPKTFYNPQHFFLRNCGLGADGEGVFAVIVWRLEFYWF